MLPYSTKDLWVWPFPPMPCQLVAAYRCCHTGQQPPQAAADFAVTSANTPVVVFALANDVDPNGDTISLTSHTVPSQGTTTFDAAGGTFLYTPRTGYVGADAFEYTITDGHGQFSTGLVTIQINAGVPPPPPPHDTRPQPPMIRSGTIMCCSLHRPR